MGNKFSYEFKYYEDIFDSVHKTSLKAEYSRLDPVGTGCFGILKNIDCLEFDIPNKNKRLWKREFWEKFLDSEETKQKLKLGQFNSLIVHPTEVDKFSYDEICASVSRMDIVDNFVVSDFKILKTPAGEVFDSFIKAKVYYGVSTRAVGNHKLEKGYYVPLLDSSFMFFGFDFVPNPAYLSKALLIYDSVYDSIQNVMIRNKELKSVSYILDTYVNELNLKNEGDEVGYSELLDKFITLKKSFEDSIKYYDEEIKKIKTENQVLKDSIRDLQKLHYILKTFSEDFRNVKVEEKDINELRREKNIVKII